MVNSPIVSLSFRFSREIPISEAIRCLEFTDGSRKLHVLWTAGEAVKFTTDWPAGIRLHRGDRCLHTLFLSNYRLQT